MVLCAVWTPTGSCFLLVDWLVSGGLAPKNAFFVLDNKFASRFSRLVVAFPCKDIPDWVLCFFDCMVQLQELIRATCRNVQKATDAMHLT